MASMPRPPLISSALTILVLGLGATAEALAPSSSLLLTVTDFAIGAEFALAGAIFLSRVPRLGVLSLAVAATWFLGTLAGAPPGSLSSIGSFFLLAYRGAILHLLLSAPSGVLGRWQARFIVTIGWVAAFLPVSVGRPGTTLAAAAAAVAIAHGAGRSPPRPTRAGLGPGGRVCCAEHGLGTGDGRCEQRMGLVAPGRPGRRGSRRRRSVYAEPMGGASDGGPGGRTGF